MRIGIDAVDLEEFEQSLARGQEAFLDQNYHPYELEKDLDVAHLAGIFAAKEALFKAGAVSDLNFSKICIKHKDNGQPYIDNDKIDLSITHTKKTAIAVVIFNNQT